MARQGTTCVRLASYYPLLILIVSLIFAVSACSAQFSPQTPPSELALIETPPIPIVGEEATTQAPPVVAAQTTAEPMTTTAVAENAAISTTAAPVSTETATEITAEPPVVTSVQSSAKLYTNSIYNYTVAYPDHWWPSGITYANAFEIRNFDPQNPAALPEHQRASLIIVDTVNETPAVTDAHLDSLLAGEGAQEITIDGRRAVRIQRERAGQQLGPGAAQTGSVTGTITEEPRYLTISTYIANGTHLISIEASVPVQADAMVGEEIVSIENSARFR